MKKQIEKILSEHIKAEVSWDESRLDGGPSAYWYGGPRAAAAIAEAVDEQLKILAQERDEFEAQNLDLRAEYDALEAQMASLRETLELAEKALSSSDPDIIAVAQFEVGQALAAAPKAKRKLWEGKGHASHWSGDDERTTVWIADGAFSVDAWILEQDSQPVTVTVTEAEEEGK